MKKINIKKILFIIFFLLTESFAFAYVGPGMGGGIFIATIGVIVAIFAAIFGLIWFPVKRYLKKRKEKRDDLKDNINHDKK